jgi:phosphoribosyl 1,2-cyclic phosphodiesterase/ActR/RegA family two-component response regulator
MFAIYPKKMSVPCMTAPHERKKILIADPSSNVIREIFKSPYAAHYDIQTTDNGPSCIAAIDVFKPDLVCIELLLPKMHGIEILKILKTDPLNARIGVIMTSSLRMLQNYNAAIELGANYVLNKPFSHEEFFALIDRFFTGTLSPDPFDYQMPHFEWGNCFSPHASTLSSYIKFWGTRGSSPVSGSRYIQYGGNTSCLEIRYNDTLIILDAGSGIRELGEVLPIKEGQDIPILLSHTHWDHVIGFPFFAPAYQKHCRLTILSPIGYQKEVEVLFADMLAFGYFPVRLEEMCAQLSFNELRDGAAVEFGPIKICCHYANHPGPTLCFKIISPNKTIGYVTDNELLLGFHGNPNAIGKDHYLLEPHLSLLAFLSDCHVLIHEAQYFPHEYYNKVGWGHSSISNALALIKHLKKCQEWIVTHHDPTHTDDDLMKKAQLHQDLMRECNLNIHFKMAYDGMIYPL